MAAPYSVTRWGTNPRPLPEAQRAAIFQAHAEDVIVVAIIAVNAYALALTLYAQTFALILLAPTMTVALLLYKWTVMDRQRRAAWSRVRALTGF